MPNRQEELRYLLSNRGLADKLERWSVELEILRLIEYRRRQGVADTKLTAPNLCSLPTYISSLVLG